MHSIAFKIIICLSFTSVANAQFQSTIKKNEVNPTNAIQFAVKTIHENTKKALNQKNISFNNLKPEWFQLKPLSGNYSYQQQGWFCKFEYRMQQKTSIPLYLRLGSKELTDKLEGKHQ